MKETLYIQPNGTGDDQDLERSFLLPELGYDILFTHSYRLASKEIIRKIVL